MANLTVQPLTAGGNTAQIDTALSNVILGAEMYDRSGNLYKYLQGVDSTVAGDWVKFDEAFLTTRLVADAVGPVAIAMAAILANQYGWYQVAGVNTIARTDTVAADKGLYIDGTTGRADDEGVAGDAIHGAMSMTADTSNVATVYITRPYVSDSAYLT